MTRSSARGLLLACLALLPAGCSGPRQDSPAQPPAGNAAPAPAPGPPARTRPPVATVSLLSDTAAIEPGKRFWLGARFAIPEGWHIYGKDPGDAGYPTKVRVEGPQGFTVGDAVYPEPHRFESPGNIVSFGYEKETMLLVPVDPPPALAAGTAYSFRAKASWLSCKDICVKESGEAVIELPPVGPDRPPRPENEAIFSSYRSRTTVPQGDTR